MDLGLKKSMLAPAFVASVLLACGKIHADDQAAGAAGAAGMVANAMGAGEAAAGGSANVGGAMQASRCNIDLNASCRDFELGPPRALLLRPDEYQNSIATLFGVTVDVAPLLQGPYGPYAVDRREQVPAQPSYADAAALAAAQIANEDSALRLCPGDACAEQFVADFAPRVWRSVVSAEDRAALVAVYDSTAGEPRDRLLALIESLLSSPRFYIRTEIGDPAARGIRAIDGNELAAKLSYLFWNDTPDDQLLDLARDGSLRRATVVVEQARRLLADPRAARGLANFYRSWLHLDGLDTVERDPAWFPGWTPELAANMKQETLEFLNWHILSGEGTLDAIFSADFSFVSPDLAALYGVAADGTSFGRVQLPPERRGLLTQASLLTLGSHAAEPSPVARALMVRELGCEEVPRASDIHAFGSIEIDRTLPAREQAHWLNESPCSQCHQLLEPVGFGFENFDAIGRYRTQDQAGPIDASGSLLLYPSEARFDFDGVPELGQYLAGSPETLTCFAERVLQWTGTSMSRCAAAQVALRTCKTGDLRESLAQITATEAFRFVGPGYTATSEETKRASCLVSGVSDCALLAEHSGVDLKTCEKCQGAPCDTLGCEQFGCQGVSVVHGCCSDDDCHGVTPYCGLHTGTHFVCVNSDAI